MKRTLQLFWHKTWDNLVQVVLINFIWFAFATLLFFAAAALVNVMAAREAEATLAEGTAQKSAVTDEIPAAGREAPTAVPQPADEKPGDAAGAPVEEQEPAAEGAEAPAATDAVPDAVMSPTNIVGTLAFLVPAWVLFSVATGFVFYATADIVTQYDFGGYRLLLRKFLRRGPVLRSVAAGTVFGVTFLVTLANAIFYVKVSPDRGIVFLVLAGLMLWFLVFLVMTYALAMPLMAQRDMRLLPAVKTAAILSLSAPVRTFVVIIVAWTIIVLSVASGAGVGFFLMSATAILFNAEVRSRLEEIEREPDPPGATTENPDEVAS
ncbi:MAG: hypothetical protein J7M19_01660 [Planctomycetes bacterium]|nr:hypothetical protein [Planctomycetota bacterium]